MEKTIKSSNVMRKVVIMVLSVIQIIPLVWGWISYVLGSVTASLFTWLSFLSPLWYPLDWGCKHLWMACDVLKQKLKGQRSDWDFSSRCWDRHFPLF